MITDFLITSAKIIAAFGGIGLFAVAAGASPAIFLPLGAYIALFVSAAWHNNFN